jgi:hypothetical protein
MASQDSSSEKMQPFPAADMMGPPGHAGCQTDRAVHQGVAGSLEVSESYLLQKLLNQKFTLPTVAKAIPRSRF